MDPMACWEHLGIEPTQDGKVIKRAFAKVIKTVDPEAEPERYQNLREAYDRARALAALPEVEFLALVSPEDVPWEELPLPPELGEDAFDRDPEPVPDEAASAPFNAALFAAVAGNQDPIDKARADAADIVVDILNALLRDDETTAVNTLDGLRRAESYRGDEVYRQEVEYMLMVGVLEAPWATFPLDFCLHVAEPWMNDRIDVDSAFWVVETDHPYWFEYFEFCHKVKAEQYRHRLQDQLDHPDGSDFSKAVHLLIRNTPDAMPRFTIPRVKMEITRIIERISADVSGAFESWMLDNEKWAAWVEWERGRRAKKGMGKLIVYPVLLAAFYLLLAGYAGMNLEIGAVYAVLSFLAPYCIINHYFKSGYRWIWGFHSVFCVALFVVWLVSCGNLIYPFGGVVYRAIGNKLPFLILAGAFVSTKLIGVGEEGPASYHHPQDPVMRAPRIH